jgi:hypothetical protein
VFDTRSSRWSRFPTPLLLLSSRLRRVRLRVLLGRLPLVGPGPIPGTLLEGSRGIRCSISTSLVIWASMLSSRFSRLPWIVRLSLVLASCRVSLSSCSLCWALLVLRLWTLLSYASRRSTLLACLTRGLMSPLVGYVSLEVSSLSPLLILTCSSVASLAGTVSRSFRLLRMGTISLLEIGYFPMRIPLGLIGLPSSLGRNL